MDKHGAHNDEEKIPERLNKNEDKFWTLFNISRAGLILLHLESHKVIEVNDSFLTMVGYRKEEVLGHTTSEIKWLDASQRQAMYDTFFANHGLIDYEIEFTNKSGKTGTVLASATQIEFGGKQCILFTVQEITQRKLIERQLAENVRKLRMVFDMSPTGIALVHYPSGEFAQINDAYLKMIGYTLQEVVGHTSVDVGWFDASERQVMINAYEKGEEKIRDYEISYTKKSGKKGAALISYEPIQINQKNYVLISIQDITQRREADEKKSELLAQLEQANKDLEAFTFTVSHDLRAPLRAITGYIQILERTDPGKPIDSKQIVDRVKNEADRMNNLVNDLLEFTRQGKAEIARATVDMTALAKSVLEDFRDDPHARDVSIQELSPAYGDTAALRQVLVNFISNALKYSQKKADPMIEVGSYSEGNENVYFVKDNGAGFDMTYYDQLFQVFHRLHSRVDFEGNGVGLAIVSKIIGKHGGRVWAKGEVGVGATFYFSLPKG